MADAVTLDRDVHWDRCAERAAPADREKIENLRVIDRIFRSRPAADRVSRRDPAIGPGPYTGRFVRGAVTALTVIAAAEVLASLALLGWSWDGFYRADGELAAYIATKLVGHALGACLLLVPGGRERRTRALGLFCLLKATHASQLVFLAFLMEAPLAQMFPDSLLDVPALLGYLVVPAYVFAPAALWVFACECPRVHRRGRLDTFARRMVPVSAAIGCAIWIVGAAALELVRSGYPAQILGPLSDALVVALDVLSFAAAAVVVLRARSAPATEVKRVLVFGLGFAMYLGVVVAYDLAEALSPGDWLSNYRWSPTVLVMELLRFPGTILLWCSVLATRIPHPREAFRALYRRLLMRPSVLAATAAVSTAALALLVASRPERAAGAIIADPLTQTLFAATGIVLLVLIGRERILQRLDVWILPETSDQRQILADAAVALSGAGRMEAVGRTVTRAAGSGSGSPATLLLAAGPRAEAPEFRSPDRRTASLRSSSAIVHLLETVGGPLRVHPQHNMSVFSLLPPDEAAWVVETDTDVMMPVPLPGTEGTGALAVGRRFDGRIVRSVDISFLQALGAIAGLAAQRLCELDESGLPSEPPPASECPVCRSVAGAGEPPACGCGPAYVETDVPKLLAGKFWVARRLGAGGMGAAYLARDLKLDRDVAVKTLLGTSVRRLMQLKPEAWAMATVTHPAVAQIHSIESWRGRPFLVVEFLPGGTLEERLLRGPVPPAQAVSDIATVADGLAALHEGGFLHGDIKPSNIGFTADRSPKLLDFGLARSTENLAASGGTLRYVSPEALSGRTADKADDVWSLCVVLHEMVSGRHPFAGGSAREVARRIGQQRVAKVAAPPVGAAAGRALIAFATSVLEAPRRARPASARAFVDALRGVRWRA